MRALCAAWGPRGEELLAAWETYEAQADAEARFVRQLDRLDMALQARVYQERGLDTAEFAHSADQAIEAPALRALLTALHPELDDAR